MGLGIPEFLIIVLLAGFWIIPLAAGIWALVTLQRLRVGQEALQVKLESIERLIQRT
jgi:hypothetical protein